MADDEINGRGVRGANLLRRGAARDGSAVVRLEGVRCKPRLLQVCSSYCGDASYGAQLRGLTRDDRGVARAYGRPLAPAEPLMLWREVVYAPTYF